MWQRIWIELIKDYDYTIEYHPEKVNMVANVLSCKNKVTLSKPPVWDERTLTKLWRLGACWAWV
jgi:aspartate carbamoyltransferase regulatory subunit